MKTEFHRYRAGLVQLLLDTDPIHTGSWQRIDTSTSPAHATYELMDVVVRLKVPPSVGQLQEQLQPDLPWAERHFLERIGGVPLNPPPSHEIWPHGKFNDRHLDQGQFSHTYPERYWPREAGAIPTGIRFRYGDLQDLLNLLMRERLTRQAYLPVWFPEDTGVHHGKRVPCTIGYHFMVRDDELSCRYYMRSCDIYRHFTNDVYMTARLMQYVASCLNEDITKTPVRVGELIMYISSLHAFVGDKSKLEAMING